MYVCMCVQMFVCMYVCMYVCMFESVVDRFDSKYGITVLSTDPWVIIFDNFLTDSEVKALITTGDLFHLI